MFITISYKSIERWKRKTNLNSITATNVEMRYMWCIYLKWKSDFLADTGSHILTSQLLLSFLTKKKKSEGGLYTHAYRMSRPTTMPSVTLLEEFDLVVTDKEGITASLYFGGINIQQLILFTIMR